MNPDSRIPIPDFPVLTLFQIWGILKSVFSGGSQVYVGFQAGFGFFASRGSAPGDSGAQ
jgi:hypothetical protein